MKKNQNFFLFLKDLIFYGFMTGLNKLSVLITFPFLARYFSVEDYGRLDFLLSLISLIIVFTTFGQDSAVGRYIQEQKTKDKQKIVVTNSFLIHIIFLVIVLILLIYLRDYLENFFYTNELFLIITLQIPFILFISFSENIFRWTFSKTKFLIISILNFFLIVVCTYLVVTTNKNIITFFNFLLYGQFFITIISFFLLINFFYFKIDKILIKKLLKYAIPCGIVCVISIFVPILERFFVKEFIGDYELGLFAVAIKISLCIGVLAQAFQSAWGPFALKKYQEKDSEKIFNLILFLFATIISFLIILIIGFSKNIVSFLSSEKYIACIFLILPICYGYSLQFLGWMLEIGIYISKKPELILFGFTAYIITSIISLHILCKYFGILGIASSIAVSFFIKIVIDLILAEKYWKAIWKIKRIIFLKLLLLILSIFLIKLHQIFAIKEVILLSLIFSVSFLFISYLFSTRDERNIMKNISFKKIIKY